MISIEAKNIFHSFNLGKVKVNALNDISFSVPSGDFVALVGKSGSGKSTLLNIIAGLTHPSSGEIIINGENITNYNENQLCIFRQKNIGFIFQSFNLLNIYNAQENVEMPLIFSGVNKKERSQKAKTILETLDMEDRLTHKPNELSGGQQQRVAIARALVNEPKIILADEPTGNLDTANGLEIIQLLRTMNKNTGATVVMVTHDNDFAKYANRVLTLKDGEIISDKTNRRHV